MLSIYDMQALTRLEERYLDPDYDPSGYSEDKDEAEFEEADRRYAEKCVDIT